MIWLTGSALAICMLMIGGLLLVIAKNGLGFFWPKPLERIALADGEVLLGEVVNREGIPNPGQPDHLLRQRIQLRTGNRDLTGSDFRWIDQDEIATRERPAGAYLIERREYGPLIGFPQRVLAGERVLAASEREAAALLPDLVRAAREDRRRIAAIEKRAIGNINYRLERVRLGERKLDLETGPGGSPPRSAAGQTAARAALFAERTRLMALYRDRQQELETLLAHAAGKSIVVRTIDDREKELRALDLYRAVPANGLGVFGRARVYASRLWTFISGDPRESNTEGGIFPAIFGTVMMVLIMSMVVVPLGVVAALYLREYARQGPLVRVVRIAVNNLAGVPSIVFGVFGIGFFVYFVGGGIDRLFFKEALPSPTYGTGGILWASLTLALLTVPVVIVAAEEALQAVPRSVREASLAMGATKFQTVLRIVLPAAAPGILTGLILAMARAAGEVAPLMLTGVVKLAPELPLDGFAPFFHLDRKFMHLGFHIYDVGFQSPNVEAAKPMVYTTAILLLLVVVALNLTAIVVRNRLRARYQSGAF